MFTGIVQGKGKVTDICDRDGQRVLRVRLPENASEGLVVGASVANNGCCLTVTEIAAGVARFDLMGETLRRTNLGSLCVGDEVNIERAARFGDEIGGHLMSGHVTTCVSVTRILDDERNRTLFFSLPPALEPYVLPKGFVGLDGCSLTVGEVFPGGFNVHLIPETMKRTLFGARSIGDAVNLEIDPQTQAVVAAVRRILRLDEK